jgi:ubiquinone/menaquinone biosynthesis C-methylase UbiE
MQCVWKASNTQKSLRSNGVKEAEKLPTYRGGGDWITMASSFHWTDPNKSLPEFHRILKPNGYLTIIWNPRDIKKSEFHLEIEKMIYKTAPHIQRVSSGSKSHTKNWGDILVSSKHFKDVIFMECDHEERMSRERYLSVWNSVNDIRVQAGERKWRKILDFIQEKTESLTEIIVPYKMRAWTAQRA